MSRGRKSERGYILLSVLLVVTVMLIALGAAVLPMKTRIRREKELELVHRGEQYTRAIQLYYRKFGHYPASVEQLENTNNIRFLRQRYKDPLTGKDDWRIIHFGEAKPKQIKTFGGAGTSTVGGGGASGGLGAPIGNAAAGPSLGTSPLDTSRPPGPGAGSSGEDQNGLGVNAADISKPLGGQTMGGGPIVGVASPVEKESIKEYEGKKHYNEWEFVYDPRYDRGMQQQPTPGQRPTRGTRDTGVPTPAPGPTGPQ
jgi:type II secretory pathway pseudopilin PulG